MSAPYLTYSRYLRDRHGCRVHRIAVDAGFSCPNRADGRAGPGCSYCEPAGAAAPYVQRNAPRVTAGGASPSERFDLEAMRRQVTEAVDFHRRGSADGAFILYFQAYSNTHASVEALRRVYDAGLSLGSFCGLNVATRPDCVDEEKADLLSSYRERGLEVWVELGLQSAQDETLRRIGRGHTLAQFVCAFEMLRRRGLKIAVHLIFGLPGEGLPEITRTMTTLALLRPDGVKIHNLHIPAGTPLAREHAKGEIVAPGPETYLRYVIAALEMLPPETVIMRLTSDAPQQSLAAPRGFWAKEVFLDRLRREMTRRGTRQGRCYPPRIPMAGERPDMNP